MVKKISLAVRSRTETNGQAKKMRLAGWIPGVVYGSDFAAKTIAVKKADLSKAYQEAGESNLINLAIDDQSPVKVLVKEVQRDRLRHDIEHVDFYIVNMKKKLEVEIPLVFIGTAKAETELGGYLNKNIEALHVRCLPGDLVDHIEVDISGLNTFTDAIKVSDLKITADFEVLNHADDTVVHVTEPKVEEEPVPVPAEGEAAASVSAAEVAPVADGGETKQDHGGD